MGMLDKLMGRKAHTSVNLAREIAAQEAGIETSRANIAAAHAARKAAIEDLDDAAQKAAEDAAAAARRDIERREVALEKLKDAHASAVDVEAREAFRREDAALAREAAALSERIKREYPSAAVILGTLVEAMENQEAKRAALVVRGRAFGEAVTCQYAETFRGGPSPKKWSATWPNPAGDGMIMGPIEDAPRGAYKWQDGEPIPTRADVTVHARGDGNAPTTLTFSIGDLPGLYVGDAPFHVQRRLPDV